MNDVNSNNNSNYPLMPSEPIIEVNSGWSFLPLQAVQKLKGIFSSSSNSDNDFISAPITTDIPSTSTSTVEVMSRSTGIGITEESLPVSYLDNSVDNNQKALELRYAPAEYSLEAKNVPFWRWMIPNDYIAEKASDLGYSIKETLYGFIPNTNNADTTREKISQSVNVNTQADESSAFDYAYDGFTKTTALMTQTFFEGTSSVSDSFVAFTASPPWDTYYRVGPVPQFTNISITGTIEGMGNDLYKSILGIGISLGVKKDNVVSLVMEQDVADQSLGTENSDILEVSNVKNVPKNVLKNVPSTTEDTATVLSVMTIPLKNRKRVTLVRDKISDLVFSSVSGTAKNIFPMTSMVYGSVARQLGKSMSKNDKNIRDSEIQNGESDDYKDLEGSQWIQNERFRSALSVTMRVIPILRIIPSFNPILSRVKSLPATSTATTTTATTTGEGGIKLLESGGNGKNDTPFAHVHVGDSERFYDLWKDDKKANDIDANKVSTKVGESSFPFDEEALTSVSSAGDESFRANAGGGLRSGFKDNIKVNTVDGASGDGRGRVMKEEEALQSYEPSVVPSSQKFKVPFSMMTGEEVSSTTIEFINQLRSPFFQNSNTETVKAPIAAPTTAAVAAVGAAPGQGLLDVEQFARPEVILPTTSSSASSAAAAASTASQSVPTAVARSTLPLSGSITPPANTSFPFNFPFDSFRSASLRGFGGLTLPPATVRDISEVTLTDTQGEDDKTKGGESYRRSSASLPRAGVSTDDELSKLGRRGQEMKNRLSFMNSDKVPLPTKADLSLILNRRVAIAVTAALACRTIADAKEYQREIGLKSLISSITESQTNEIQVGSLSLNGIKGVCRLIRIDNSVAVKVVAVPEIISALCDAMEAPFKVILCHFILIAALYEHFCFSLQLPQPIYPSTHLFIHYHTVLLHFSYCCYSFSYLLK